jgi:hypothetical protein
MTFLEKLKKDLNNLGYYIQYKENKKGKINNYRLFVVGKKDFLVSKKDIEKVNKLFESKEEYKYLFCEGKERAKGFEAKIKQKILAKRINQKKKEKEVNQTVFPNLF